METMTEQELLDHGYRKYQDYFHKKEDRSYQRRVMDSKGTQYFITVHAYDIYPNYFTALEVELQFSMFTYTVNIKMFNLDQNMTVTDMEFECDKMWTALSKAYYEEN
jgi:hypothetical protein